MNERSSLHSNSFDLLTFSVQPKSICAHAHTQSTTHAFKLSHIQAFPRTHTVTLSPMPRHTPSRSAGNTDSHMRTQFHLCISSPVGPVIFCTIIQSEQTVNHSICSLEDGEAAATMQQACNKESVSNVQGSFMSFTF